MIALLLLKTLSIMPHSEVGLLVFLVNLVSSMECPGCRVSDNLIGSFNDKAVTDFVLAESASVSKVMDCVVMCSRDIRCRSYRHNALTETCSTYGAGYSLPEKTINAVTAEAGSRLYAMCGVSKSLGSSCSTDADCDFANSACLSSSCSCSVGFSYDMWTGDCLIRCSAYGDGFTGYPEAGVDGCNIKTLTRLTLQECKDACTGETTFVCVNVEYSSSELKCNMCDTVWFDLDTAQQIYTGDVGWVLQYRHCAS